MASSGKNRSAAARSLMGVAVLVVLLFGALTVAWFYFAGELERRAEALVAEAGQAGTIVGCPGRDVFGYPFRLGVSCAETSLERPSDGLRLSAGALRTAAQLYDPGRIVAELDGPLRVTSPDLPPLEMRWDLAQSSAALGESGLDRLSLVLTAPSLSAGGEEAASTPLGSATRAELHLRRNGADLDLALRDEALILTAPAIGALPPFDFFADTVIANGAGLLDEGLPPGGVAEALKGRSGTLRAVRLDLQGGGSADISGPFEVNAGGEISGQFAVGVENAQAIVDLVARLVPGSAGIAGTIANALQLAGRQEGTRTVVDISVDDGEARLGFIPLGQLPSL